MVSPISLFWLADSRFKSRSFYLAEKRRFLLCVDRCRYSPVQILALVI